ncbi:MAG TPA: dihydrolipoyllysine-residue acetyltransferase [Gammaproteobacteria bacterium]|nr:dihydrolipoyllysine-residue acetyltransferase [Gammaproteobacteria bacterium]
MAHVDVVVPDLGDFADVEIIEILVKPGDEVAAEQGLITLETEKATMDVPSPAPGRVDALRVKVGDRVSKGDVILSLATGSAGAAPATSTGDSMTVRQPKTVRPPEDKTVRQPKVVRDPEDKTVRQPRPVAAAQTIVVPDLGDFANVEVIDVLVKPGDEVAAEQGLVTLETEKASMDVPAPLAGTVLELKVAVGARVSAGDPVVVLRPSAGDAPANAGQTTAGRSAAAALATAASAAPAVASQAPPAQTAPGAGRAAAPAPRTAGPSSISAAPTSFAQAHASPSVRKLGRELGVDLGRVRGSGHKGRVTADDVKAFVKEIMLGGGPAARGPALPALPNVDFAKYGPTETEPLSRIQKISGPRLHASWVNIPHVTQHDEADITELEERRNALKDTAQQRGIKLTPLAFIIRAVALALAEMPLFKSSLAPDGENLIVKKYTHIGFAVDTPGGLVVPVIRDADKKDIYELAKSLATLSERARTGKLQADDIQGGVFTISSLGSIGGRFFTPIINAPEVAILGVSRSSWQPVYRNMAFVPRLILPLSLAYDHRVIDGAKGVRFTTRLGEILADAGRLVEAIP